MTNPMNTPSSDDKLWAGLGYAGLVCCMIPAIVIFFLKKDESAYIKFNNLQSLGYGLINIVLGVLMMALVQIPVLGMVFGLAQLVLTLGLLGYWVYLMIQGFTGKDVRIPILGDWIDQNLMN